MIDRLPGFQKRMEWFLKQPPRPGPAHRSATASADGEDQRTARAPAARDPVARAAGARAAATCSTRREFLSPYGIRSLSRVHRDHPYAVRRRRQEHRVDYVPGESNTGLFGGNSNWRGPIWFPVNYLLVEALERYHHFYGDDAQGRVPDRLGPDDELCRRSRTSWRRG